MTRPLKLGQIGFGGIGSTVAEMLSEDNDIEYVAVATRRSQDEAIKKCLPETKFVENPKALIATHPDLVIECGSHSALRGYGAPVLKAGIDLLAISVGVLADQNERLLLMAAAEEGDSSIEIPAGAVGGIDVVSAARHSGIKRITYVTRKAPSLWAKTPAAEMLDLSKVTEPVMFFKGTAGEGAKIFEEKLNVAATIAMAGIGFERTTVELWADPKYPQSTHFIKMEAESGTMNIELTNTVTPANEKSSLLTAAAIVQAVKRRSARIKI